MPSCDLNLLAKYFQFKEKWGQNITEINLVDLDLPTVEMFYQIVKDLKNLRKLRFEDCRFIDPMVYPSTPVISLNITSLEILQPFSEYLDEDFLNYMFSLVPNLKSFFCGFDGIDESIGRYLMNPKLTISLRELRIVLIRVNTPFTFSTLNNLNLEIFQMDAPFDHYLSSDDFEAFLTSQTKLKILKISLYRGTFLSQLIRVCTVNSIQDLTFNFKCPEPEGVQNYEIFWKLKLLNLSYANGALFESLTKASAMESLTLSFGDDSMLITNKFQYLKNLKVLNIHLKGFITNEFIQTIFENLYNLQELYLKDLIYVSF